MNKKEDYRDWLHSKEWKYIRGGEIRRTRGVCEICGHKSVHNDVHHIIYRKERTDVRKGDCKVLCRACHKATHKSIDLIGGEYETLDVPQRWKRTLNMIASHELRPLRYLQKHISKRGNKKITPLKKLPKKKIAKNDREAEEVRAEIRRNIINNKVRMVGKIFPRLTAFLKREGADILGVSYPMSKGWRDRYAGTHIALEDVERLFELRYNQRISSSTPRPLTAPGATPKNRRNRKAQKRASKARVNR